MFNSPGHSTRIGTSFFAVLRLELPELCDKDLLLEGQRPQGRTRGNGGVRELKNVTAFFNETVAGGKKITSKLSGLHLMTERALSKRLSRSQLLGFILESVQ